MQGTLGGGLPPSAEVPRRDLKISKQIEPNTPDVPEARWRFQI